MVLSLFYLIFLAFSLFVLYFVIRKAVHHGVLDADETRRARADQDRLQRSLQQGAGPEGRDVQS